MTIRPLPEIDLARIAPLPDDAKRSSLQRLRSGRPPFSYKPVRTLFPDLFNIQAELFGSSTLPPWSKIDDELKKRAKTADELLNNRRVAQGLHAFAYENGVAARKHEFFPLAMGMGNKVTYWLPMVASVSGVPHALFIDPRRSQGLSAAGRRFVFSMMHERIRQADADYAGLSLGIIQFADPADEIRKVKLYSDGGMPLHTMEELEHMVSSTYRIWTEVSQERAEETRRKATGTGPLL